MLESTYESLSTEIKPCDEKAFQAALGKLPLEITVPRKMFEHFQGTGPTQTAMSEQRRYVRFRHLTKGILGYKQTFPAIRRTNTLHMVLITNVSRCGLGLLSHEQLFPGERMNLWISGRGIIQITVARCRKENDRCFEVGTLIGI